MNILKNKIYVYMSTRYLTYGLQFVLSMVIAGKLGPHFLGVYGMVNLIISYFGQVNFGIPHALNVLLIHNKNDKYISNAYILNSLSIYVILSLLIVLIYCLLLIAGCNFCAGDYNMETFMPLIVCIAVLTYVNSIFTTVSRVKNDVNLLSIVGSVPVALNILVIWFYEGVQLVYALTGVQLLSALITMLLCYKRDAFPKWDRKSIRTNYKSDLIKKGIFLFLYNSCFYFILISVRTIISSNYSVDEFGYFTFSFTIANAVMLFIDSFNTIIFPKTIDLMSSDDRVALKTSMDKMRIGYAATSHMLIYFAMIFYPIFGIILPKYQEAIPTMYMISLTVLMNTTSFGFTSLLIAKNKERTAGKISLFALLLNLLLCMFLVKIVEVAFSQVIIGTLISYMFFAFLCAYEGNKILSESGSVLFTLKTFFPIRMFIPYCLALGLSIHANAFLMWIPFAAFMFLNRKDLGFLMRVFNKLTNNPSVIDV